MSMICRSLSARLSFGYERIPQDQFKLSIFKLNGSFFEVELSMTATVGELKQAVEEFFSCSPEDDMYINISWSHVWSHFCLCYKDEKLIDDKAYIRSYGIKNGHHLYFAINTPAN
ncbi:U11/U12 small nuclear ribonucleoprotein 25 kDa protein isoform X2 [Jatropha curcas]|uniref:U11/U12 small nuclear ribonucleoprotein 25 kDa protein isoform X2 n=1 Tax=Jatropha curcas TaxID=180498 RepID=UPI001895B6D9|nr:U11/U12 small nuclear ribonucleoprotein 25 kDa protein isoform X2 [Jatropha curcas]